MLLTEVSIAGGNSRTTSSLSLRDAWLDAAAGLGVDYREIGLEEKVSPCWPTMLIGCRHSPIDSLRLAGQLLHSVPKDANLGRLIIVTGSLHIVAHVLASIQ